MKNLISSTTFFTGEKKKIKCKYVYSNDTENYVICSNNIVIFESELLPFGTYWLNFFDSQNEKDTFDTVITDLSYKLDNFHNLLLTLSSDNFTNFLSEYADLVNVHPFFSMYFDIIYELCYSYYKTNTLSDNILTKLSKEFRNLLLAHTQYEIYIYETLVLPIQKGMKCCTGILIARKEAYASQNNIKTPYSINYTSTDAVLSENTNTGVITKDYDFSRQFSLGIEWLIEKNYILKICQNCHKYFKSSRDTKIMYCNRIFRNQLTCQNIGANIKHQKKVASNPIQNEYRKYYNKIFTRIRRKTLDSQNAHLEELKQLRKKYEHLYEISITESDKEKTVNAFIADMDSLYKIDPKKNTIKKKI